MVEGIACFFTETSPNTLFGWLPLPQAHSAGSTLTPEHFNSIFSDDELEATSSAWPFRILPLNIDGLILGNCRAVVDGTLIGLLSLVTFDARASGSD